MGIEDEPLAEKKENGGRNAGEMIMMIMQETNSQKSKSKGVQRKME